MVKKSIPEKRNTNTSNKRQYKPTSNLPSTIAHGAASGFGFASGVEVVRGMFGDLLFTQKKVPTESNDICDTERKLWESCLRTQNHNGLCDIHLESFKECVKVKEEFKKEINATNVRAFSIAGSNNFHEKIPLSSTWCDELGCWVESEFSNKE